MHFAAVVASRADACGFFVGGGGKTSGGRQKKGTNDDYGRALLLYPISNLNTTTCPPWQTRMSSFVESLKPCGKKNLECSRDCNHWIMTVTH